MTISEIPTLTHKELKHVLLVGCNLHQYFGSGNEGIRTLIKAHGFVQLDPLSPAGRYHDYFFHARLNEYSMGQFEQLAYLKDRLVFETYFHNLNAIFIEHFPFFNSYTGKEHLGRYYSRLLKNLEQVGGSKLLDEVYSHVKVHGPTKSADLAKLGKADPKYASWKSSRNSGTALELLWCLGKLAIVERDNNFRKKYDLTEQYFTKELLKKNKYSEEERQLYRLKLKLRAFPIIPIGKLTVNKEGEIRSSKKQEFSLSSLQKIKKTHNGIFPILTKDKDDLGYVISSNWKELSKDTLDSEMRVIGPLDPVIWERDLLKRLFNFEYVWEVYKKVEDRVWGYYVYPLLYKGVFIGRLEAKYVKKTKVLELFNFQKEKTIKIDEKILDAFERMIQRWKNMVGAEKLDYDSTLPNQLSHV